MLDLIYRLVKGSPLTWSELDGNFKKISDQTVTKEELGEPNGSSLVGYPGVSTSTVKDALDQVISDGQSLEGRVDHAILSYPTLAEAQAAAATLPDGQEVAAEELLFKVQSGSLVFSRVWRSTRRFIRDFNAAGNGIADDTDAVLSAITSGHPLDWENKIYRVTREVYAQVAHRLDWVSSGAIIRLDAANHQPACLHLSVAEYKHTFVGLLEIDVQKKSNVGFKAYPTIESASPDFLAEDLFVRNVHRTSAHTDGDGILLIKGWGTVTLVRPKIRDFTMAVGAGIAGSMGIFGITVTRGGTSNRYSAKYVSIINPDIDGIWSDDPEYLADQDGIRVFTRYGGSATAGKQNEMTFTVLGGVIKDVRGRSVKGQTERGGVDGLSVVRTTRASGGISRKLTTNADVELQTGGGYVRNLEFSYDGFVPNVAARIIQADFTVAYTTPPIISNVNGVVVGSLSPTSAVAFSLGDYTTSTGSEKFLQACVSNINVVSDTPLTNAVACGRSGVTANSMHLAATNITVPVSSAFINNRENTASSLAMMTLVNLQNTAGSTVNLLTTVTGYTVEASNMLGIVNNGVSRSRSRYSVIGQFPVNYEPATPLVVGKGTLPNEPVDATSRVALFYRDGAAGVQLMSGQSGASTYWLGTVALPQNVGYGASLTDGNPSYGYVSVNGITKYRFTETAFEPNSNDLITFGSASRRAAEVFATNGVINTSDSRLKTPPEDVPQALIDAIASLTPKYWQWLSSVDAKGVDARRFAGPIAQDVRDALVAHGIMEEGSANSPWAGLCYDEWPDEYEAVIAEREDEEGNIEAYDTGERRLVLAAGNRWSVRHDQILYVMLLCMARRADRIEARLDSLESK